jgi:hypothetical protein
VAETTPGQQFARALAAKDFDAVKGLLAADVDFRAVTPNRFWEESSPDAVVSGILVKWFEPDDEIVAVEQIEGDVFADRERVGYRLRVRNPEGSFLVEQQGFIGTTDGQIDWVRIACSGFRPVKES